MQIDSFTVGTIIRPTSLGGALKHFGVSSTLRRRIKHNGICTINGQAASTRDFVHEGDEICVTLPEKNPFPPQDIPIGIVYEDDYLMVIDKPAGLLMHPTSAVRDGTLANAVAYHYEQTGQHCSYHPCTAWTRIRPVSVWSPRNRKSNTLSISRTWAISACT